MVVICPYVLCVCVTVFELLKYLPFRYVNICTDISCKYCIYMISELLARDAWTTSHWCYMNSTVCPSESMSTSKWYAWFTSHCPGMHLSTWQMIAASCPTALGALYSQLMSQLASYHERTPATFAAAGPRLWNSLLVQLRNPDITYGLFRRQLKGQLFGKA